jgi:hypothetical protein
MTSGCKHAIALHAKHHVHTERLLETPFSAHGEGGKPKILALISNRHKHGITSEPIEGGVPKGVFDSKLKPPQATTGREESGISQRRTATSEWREYLQAGAGTRYQKSRRIGLIPATQWPVCMWLGLADARFVPWAFFPFGAC